MVAIAPLGLLGQDKPQAPAGPPANPITQSEKGLYSFISGAVVKAAEKMPEENYSFKPTPDVRSFGQLVGRLRGRRQLHVLLAGLRGSESDEGHRENEDIQGRSCVRDK